MKYHHLILLAALAAPAAATDGGFRPGQWSVVVTVNSASIPGLPSAAAQAMQGQPRRFSECISAEQAISGPQELLREAPGCSFTSYSMADGRISADMRCSQGGGTMASHISGTYAATSMRATSEATASGRIAMRLTSTIVGRWIGACF